MQQARRLPRFFVFSWTLCWFLPALISAVVVTVESVENSQDGWPVVLLATGWGVPLLGIVLSSWLITRTNIGVGFGKWLSYSLLGGLAGALVGSLLALFLFGGLLVTVKAIGVGSELVYSLVLSAFPSAISWGIFGAGMGVGQASLLARCGYLRGSKRWISIVSVAWGLFALIAGAAYSADFTGGSETSGLLLHVVPVFAALIPGLLTGPALKRYVEGQAAGSGLDPTIEA